MNYQISYEKRALIELRKLDKLLAKRIIKKIKGLETDPFSKDIKHLKGQSSFRLRVGDYRIIYKILQKEVRILVIKHRSVVYKNTFHE